MFFLRNFFDKTFLLVNEALKNSFNRRTLFLNAFHCTINTIFLIISKSEILKNRYLLTVSSRDNVASTIVTSTEFAFFIISQNNAQLSRRCIEFNRKSTTIAEMHDRLFVTTNTKRQLYALTIFERFEHTDITSQSFRANIKERRIISLKKLNLERERIMLRIIFKEIK